MLSDVKKRNYNTQLFKDILLLLEADKALPLKHKAHKLINNYSEHWECHIKPDWLLIWTKDEVKKEIHLIRMGTHSDLFK